ncbi:transport permease protein [Sphaerisporangium krabiense]|uniref:Transport permease protein n=1 Tax=Sphaerisporangium krabiense TaxID=763782 RepID=A0A7W8YZ38_9ACTN|nr:ABC transporter permease [Sphaerisporangium krabiense]MBB5624410.1 ABC-2 type transport system permease protein [Sphaerisporangium krabiense]GII61634.1 transport permease protein [Sphaerisporangium krabiense]
MSDTVAPAAATARTRHPLPSVLATGWSRAAAETRMFFREKDAVIFTFAFPIILLVIFGSIFQGRVNSQITVAQLYAAGLIGAGVMSTSFQSLGVGIAVDREDGTLKRLAGTPMPRAAYFLGKIINVLLLSLLEVAILLAVGVALYDLEPPSAAGSWVTFAWVFVLGITASSLLGIAVSSLPRSAKSATAVISLPFVVLQFISGVFIPFNQLPDWLIRVASFLPLKWMCQGFRSVFLGDAGASLEPAKSYELGRVALILGAWVIGGLVLCLMTFRWKGRRDG